MEFLGLRLVFSKFFEILGGSLGGRHGRIFWDIIGLKFLYLAYFWLKITILRISELFFKKPGNAPKPQKVFFFWEKQNFATG